MLRRSLVPSILVVLALVLPSSTGCSKKPQLTEVAVPEAGISMRYDLAPGQEYLGHVKLRNAIQTPVGEVVTIIEFDAVLVASANETAGGRLVRATVSNIKLDLRLPEGIPAAAVGGLTPEAAAALDGTELPFDLSDRGEVSNDPEPPATAPMETKAIFIMITSALTGGFVRVPEQPVKDGESWDASSSTPRAGVRSSSTTGTLEGLARNGAGEDIAQLALVGQMQAEREGRQVKTKQTVKASFSTTAGFPIAVTRSINTEVEGQGTVLIEIEAEWKKGGKRSVPAASPTPEPEVQEITDPCDPDYVGAEECPADAAPPEAAPKG
jgi:hypothetical protein